MSLKEGVVYEPDCTIHHVWANDREYLIECEKILVSDENPTLSKFYCAYIMIPYIIHMRTNRQILGKVLRHVEGKKDDIKQR